MKLQEGVYEKVMEKLKEKLKYSNCPFCNEAAAIRISERLFRESSYKSDKSHSEYIESIVTTCKSCGNIQKFDLSVLLKES